MGFVGQKTILADVARRFKRNFSLNPDPLLVSQISSTVAIPELFPIRIRGMDIHEKVDVNNRGGKRLR